MTEQKAKPRVGRPAKPEKSRDIAQRLRGVALDLFADRGFGDVSIKQIAQVAGVNTAMIYYYFNSKEDLRRAAIEDTAKEVFAAFSNAINADQDAALQMRAWLDVHVRMSVQIGKMIKVAMDMNANEVDNPARENPVNMFYELERSTLEGILQRGMASGHFRPVNVNETRRIISTFLDGATIRARIRPDFDPARAIGNFYDVLAAFLTP